MQEAIYEIGKVLGDTSIDNLLLKLDAEKREKIQHVCKLKFYTREKKLIIDIEEEISKKTPREYLYVDRIGGPNSHQWLVSRNSINYHLSETLPYLREEDLQEGLKEKINVIIKNYYLDLGEGYNKKYRYLLNLKDLGIDTEYTKEKAIAFVEETKDGEKEIIKKIEKDFFKHVKKTFGVTDKEIGLYTIYIDDEAISKRDDYINLVISKKLGEKKVTSNKKSKSGICYLCNKESASFGDLSKCKLKFFIKDKINFAHNLNKPGFEKNLRICNECLNYYLAGENFVTKYLNTNLFGFYVYIIPHFIINNPVTKKDLENISQRIVRSFNSVKSYNSIEEVKDEISTISEINEDSYYLINFIFYKNVQQGTKVRRMIKDVSPSIFQDIREASLYTNDLFEPFKLSKVLWEVNLNTVYNLTPIRINNKKEFSEYNKILQLYDAIFTKTKINKEIIIGNILKAVKIKAYNIEGYNIKAMDREEIAFTVIEGLKLIRFLKRLGCIKEDENLELDLNLNQEVKDFVKAMNYGEEETSLFLLGYLVGAIGNQESKKSSEGRKPILKKLNYSGLDKEKLIGFRNLVFEKLVQREIVNYNTVIYHDCAKLMDKNLNSWKLTSKENLFYLLSGYSYCTTKAIIAGSKKKNDKGENKNE